MLVAINESHFGTGAGMVASDARSSHRHEDAGNKREQRMGLKDIDVWAIHNVDDYVFCAQPIND